MKIKIQNRILSESEIQWIRQLMAFHPEWHRTRLSREICRAWNWTNAKGQLKDMACRTMLLKLERIGHISLPAAQNPGGGHVAYTRKPVAHQTDPVVGTLREQMPLQVEVVQDHTSSQLFKHLLAEYHYLGFSGSVGENLKYLIFNRYRRPLACFLFGSAAWKVAPRDQWIGWSADVRETHLSYVTNNMRFLVMPWVRVPHAASHMLGLLARRISNDWMDKYGHPVCLLETFVEQDRFRGTCYQAANWIYVGQTQGRSRNDTHHMLRVPVKDVYLYPLIPRVKEVLNDERRRHSQSI